MRRQSAMWLLSAGTALVAGLASGCRSAPPHGDLPPPAAGDFYTVWRSDTPVVWVPAPVFRPDPAPPNFRSAPLPPHTVNPPLSGRPLPQNPQPPPDPPSTVNPSPAPRGIPQGWLPDAAAEARRRRDAGPWKYIVIHHSDSDRGNLAAIKAYHVNHNKWKDAGYNFIIGNGSLSGNGEVEVGGRWERQEDGAHAGIAKYNREGIGICLVGDFTTKGPTAQQMASLTRLIGFLCDRYGIPRDRKHILGHRDTGRSTDCPGKLFPWNDLMRRL